MFLRGATQAFFPGTTAEASEFQSAIDGFCAAVGEENAVEAGPLDELVGQRPLIGVVVEIRKMNSAGDFTANGFYNARMRVAEGVDSDTAEKIEIFFSAGVIHITAASMGEDKRLSLVGGEQELIGIVQTRIFECFLGARFLADTRGANERLLVCR